MIIISKKRILFTITCIAVGIIAFLGQKKAYKNTVQTVALPVTNKVIVVDAGHGKPDERSGK